MPLCIKCGSYQFRCPASAFGFWAHLIRSKRCESTSTSPCRSRAAVRSVRPTLTSLRAALPAEWSPSRLLTSLGRAAHRSKGAKHVTGTTLLGLPDEHFSLFGCLTSAGHLESCSPHTTMARADDVVRRRRFDVDDVLPLLIPAIALLTTTQRRRDPAITGDAWHACVLTGCANIIQPNEAHSFPYLATLVSLLFLVGISVSWQLMAMLGQKSLMGIRVKPGPGGGG